MAKSKEFYFVSVLSYLNGVPVGETVMLCLTRLFCVQYVWWHIMYFLQENLGKWRF